MAYQEPMIAEPLLPDVGICALVPDTWEAPWQPRHYVLRSLARYFNIVWVNPAPDWRSLFRVPKESELEDNSLVLPRGLLVYQSVLLPRLYHPEWLSRYSFNARLKQARSLLINQGCRKIIIYLWRPEFGSALDG